MHRFSFVLVRYRFFFIKGDDESGIFSTMKMDLDQSTNLGSEVKFQEKRYSIYEILLNCSQEFLDISID